MSLAIREGVCGQCPSISSAGVQGVPYMLEPHSVYISLGCVWQGDIWFEFFFSCFVHSVEKTEMVMGNSFQACLPVVLPAMFFSGNSFQARLPVVLPAMFFVGNSFQARLPVVFFVGNSFQARLPVVLPAMFFVGISFQACLPVVLPAIFLHALGRPKNC